MIAAQFSSVVDINRTLQPELVGSLRSLLKVENFCNLKEGFVEFYLKFIAAITSLVYIYNNKYYKSDLIFKMCISSMNLPICAKQVFKYSQINKLASDNQGIKV